MASQGNVYCIGSWFHTDPGRAGGGAVSSQAEVRAQCVDSGWGLGS